MKAPEHLLIFGHGYVAKHLAKAATTLGWEVSISSRTPPQENLNSWQIFPFGGNLPKTVTAVLSTSPPAQGQDPVLAAYRGQFPKNIKWVGYLSSTGVYGDTYGQKVTEKSPLLATSMRGQARIGAEKEWLALKAPVHIFRLAGIYGPERNMLKRLKEGKIQNFEQSNRPVNRIHVADIVRVLLKSIQNPKTKSVVYNLSDDKPAPTQEVLAYGAELLGMTFSSSTKTSSTSHLHDGSRIVCNQLIKNDLSLKLTYPTYKEGLKALLTQT